MPTMNSPKSLQNVFVVAQQPAALHEFYEQALGLELKFRDQDRWIQYRVGRANVALACPQESLPATRGVVMVFEVDEFEQAAQRVIAFGAEVLGMRDMGTHGAVLSLRDPEGNIVQLYKRQAQEAL